MSEAVVNKTRTEHPQPGIGHNRPSLSDAAEQNIRTGVLLLCKEALITAIQDRRLQRPHLRVLASIATCINTRTAKAWPDRVSIASMSGLSVKSVSNVILELRGWGYLVADRETVEEAGNRRLTVYTFGNIDHEGIRREIEKFVRQLREKHPAPAGKSRQDGNIEFPPQRDVVVPPQQEVPVLEGTLSSRPSGKVPPEREKSSRQDGDSNSIKELSAVDVTSTANGLFELRERLMRVAGAALANEAAAPGLLHIGIVAGWIASGCDLELDIVPAVDACARSAIRAGKKIHSWSYFAQAVADAKAARTLPMPVGQAKDTITAKRMRMRLHAEAVEAEYKAKQQWSGRQ